MCNYALMLYSEFFVRKMYLSEDTGEEENKDVQGEKRYNYKVSRLLEE